MKFIYLLGLFLVSLQALANPIFAKYAGCYKTLVFNGAIVNEDPKFLGITEIKEGQAFAVLDPATSKAIPAVALMIYQGYIEETHINSYDAVDAFSDRGTSTTDEAGDHFLFEGSLSFLPKPRITANTHLKVDITKMARELLFVEVSRKVDGYEEMNEDNGYLLEKIDCPQ